MPADANKDLREALYWMLEATLDIDETDAANTNLVMARYHAREILIRLGYPWKRDDTGAGRRGPGS